MPTIDVTPSKYVFNALAADITETEAISDLVDNSLDSLIASKVKGQLEVYLTLEENKMLFSDNAGGIDIEALPLLLMPGGSKWKGGEGIKGIWGIGSKRALFVLGRKFTIRTRAKGERGLVLTVDENWFLEDELEDRWKIEYTEDDSIVEGTTTIEIEDLKVDMNPFSMSKIRELLTNKYKDEISEGVLKLFFNGEQITKTPEIPWAKSKFAPPARYITDIPVPDTKRKLHVEVTVGVMTSPGGDYTYGIDFIGNKRLVLQHNIDWRMGFEKKRLGAAHPTINRFRAVVRVSGDSKDIPWNSAKNDVNPNHIMYRPVADLVFQVSRQYVTFLRKNYEVTSRLFKIRAESSDIKNKPFTYGKTFGKVVKDYKEPKKEVRVPFTVPQEEYDELVDYFGLRGRPKKYVGEFIFKLVLGEVVRGGEV